MEDSLHALENMLQSPVKWKIQHMYELLLNLSTVVEIHVPLTPGVLLAVLDLLLLSRVISQFYSLNQDLQDLQILL